MNKAEQLKAEISKLQAKYQACTTRAVYKIGAQIRAKQQQLKSLTDEV